MSRFRFGAAAALLAVAVLTLTGCFSGLGGLTGQQQTTTILKTQATFSPDGTKIIFISTETGEAQIYTANVDGTGVKQLTTGSINAQPTWSPDGTKVLFSSNRASKDGSEFELYVMNADGSDQRMIEITIPSPTK